MTQLDAKLQAYRAMVGQWLDRKRALEMQAQDAAQNAKIIEARIAGILEAQELIALEATEASPSVSATGGATISPRKRQRSLTEHWQQIMQLVDGADGFDYDDLADAVETVGHDANRDTLRSQMSNYKGVGLVEAIGDGRFKLTDAGRRAAGITGGEPPNENGVGDTASDEGNEGAATPSNPPFFGPLAPLQER